MLFETNICILTNTDFLEKHKHIVCLCVHVGMCTSFAFLLQWSHMCYSKPVCAGLSLDT